MSAKLTDQSGQAELLPFYIFPVEIWLTDPNLTLVNSLGIWPSASWNRAFLPANDDWAFTLNSLPHPHDIPADQFEFADKIMTLVEDGLREVAPLYAQLAPESKFASINLNILINRKRALERMMKDCAQQYLRDLRASWYKSATGPL